MGEPRPAVGGHGFLFLNTIQTTRSVTSLQTLISFVPINKIIKKIIKFFYTVYLTHVVCSSLLGHTRVRPSGLSQTIDQSYKTAVLI